MIDVNNIKEKPGAMFLNTGSPHHVQMVENLSEFMVKKEAGAELLMVYGVVHTA